MTLLSLFGAKDVKNFRYVLVKHTPDGNLYFSRCIKGVADFTLDRTRAWRFDTPEEAAKAQRSLGVFYRGLSIIEIDFDTKHIANEI